MTTILTFPLRVSEPAELEQPTALVNALTIDVEEYFHVSGFARCIDPNTWDDLPSRVADSTDRILDILAEANVQATFFVLGWVAERQPSLVRAIRDAGHEVGSHGYSHQLIYDQTPDEFREDLRRSIDILEDTIGQRVRCYRAPSFSITKRSTWALDILIEEGITLDSSIYPTRHDRYGIPDAPVEPHRITRPVGTIWEFPPPVCRLMGYPMPVGGGGYFRLYPYAMTRLGLSRINAEGRPFSVYLHPWEFDPDQPRVKAGWARSFRHYVGLRRSEARLAAMLRDFPFGTISESLASFEPTARQPMATRRAA